MKTNHSYDNIKMIFSKFRQFTVFFGIAVAGLWGYELRAEVKCPAIFGDHMVLQRDMACPVWGSAEPGEKVTVTVGSVSETCTTGADGKWSVKLLNLSASMNPVELKIAGKNQIKYSDVLVGDVWLCSGQSNMWWPVKDTHRAQQDIPKANHPTLRLYMAPSPEISVTTNSEWKPNGIWGRWMVCTPETVPWFSAVGYYFGKNLNEKLQVPMGLINSTVSGSAAQAWTTLESLQKHSELKEYLDLYNKMCPNFDEICKQWNISFNKFQEQLSQWQNEFKNSDLQQQEKLKLRKPRIPSSPIGPTLLPTCRFNTKIAPMIPFGIKGVIWYQGEANVDKANQYRVLFPALITGWREAWGQGDFPFLYVQLANFNQRGGKSVENTWAYLREAQTSTLTLPQTGMAVSLDMGKGDDIHPRNKLDVGYRLSLVALKVAYHQDIVFSGPRFDSMSIEGHKIKILFKCVGGGLVIDSSPAMLAEVPKAEPSDQLLGFAIAGADKIFVPAKAVIEGEAVIVWSDEIMTPLAVRYGFSNNPEVNLYNKELLPAGPFRTDNWDTK